MTGDFIKKSIAVLTILYKFTNYVYLLRNIKNYIL